MCIQFVYINNSAEGSGVSLIIANNRDEYFARPTLQANPWPDKPWIMSGLDAEPGREGGTWFGINIASAQIGSLLNLWSPTGPDSSLAGRGFLVTNYLTGEDSAETYLKQLSKSDTKYNGFNLLLIERQQGQWVVWYYSNEDPTSPRIIDQNVIGISNTNIDYPRLKVKYGLQQLGDVLCQQPNVSESESVIIDLMQDRTYHWPDANTAFQEHSAIFVDIPAIDYGTRCTSLLTVLANGQAKLTEIARNQAVNTMTFNM